VPLVNSLVPGPRKDGRPVSANLAALRFLDDTGLSGQRTPDGARWSHRSVRLAMADLIEAVEELLFNAEMMTSGTPEFSLDERDLITFRALAGQLYTEALNIQQLANNYDYRLIEPAYLQLNQTCGACHSLFRK